MPDEYEMPNLLPPGWVLTDWQRKNGVAYIKAERCDGLKKEVRVDLLPAMVEKFPLNWLKEVLDLKLWWAVS